MELTKEHFDNQLEELNNRMDGMTVRMNGMATKEDLKEFATKEDLKGFATKEDLTSALAQQTAELESYTDSVAQTILTAVDSGFNKVHERLEKVEVKY